MVEDAFFVIKVLGVKYFICNYFWYDTPLSIDKLTRKITLGHFARVGYTLTSQVLSMIVFDGTRGLHVLCWIGIQELTYFL